jgi:hypothetical protein
LRRWLFRESRYGELISPPNAYRRQTWASPVCCMQEEFGCFRSIVSICNPCSGMHTSAVCSTTTKQSQICGDHGWASLKGELDWFDQVRNTGGIQLCRCSESGARLSLWDLDMHVLIGVPKNERKRAVRASVLQDCKNIRQRET